MPVFRLLPASCLFVALAAGAAGAQQRAMLVYDCSITATRGNLIGPQLQIYEDTASGDVEILDNMIYEVNDRTPVHATRVTENASRLTVSWRLDHVRGKRETAALDYSATVTKADLRVSINASARGFDNNEGGGGTCTLTGR